MSGERRILRRREIAAVRRPFGAGLRAEPGAGAAYAPIASRARRNEWI